MGFSYFETGNDAMNAGIAYMNQFNCWGKYDGWATSAIDARGRYNLASIGITQGKGGTWVGLELLAETWYYVLKTEGGEHAMAYNPYNQIIYEVNNTREGTLNRLWHAWFNDENLSTAFLLRTVSFKSQCVQAKRTVRCYMY